MSISEKIHRSPLGQMYDLNDPWGRGRALTLVHAVLDYIVAILTSGVFYTSFLMVYGIDIVGVGILSFMPYIAQTVSLVSPCILERLPRRRWFLAGCRLAYFLLAILGVTVMPELVTDADRRMACFVGLILVANIFNALSGQGYTVWHAQYIPPKQRYSFFQSRSIASNLVATLIAISLSLLADVTAGTALGDAVIISVRYVAFTVALLDILVLLMIKEHPYPKTQKRGMLFDVFTLPLKQRRFRNTMIVCFTYFFVNNLDVGVITYYLLNKAKMPYSLAQFIDVSYTMFLVLFLPFWQRKLERQGWIKVFNICRLLEIPALILFAFVNENNLLWLYTAIRLYQHFYASGQNSTFTNFLYMNMPAEDQTNYTTFYSLGTSLFSFLGISTGTWFVSWMGDRSLNVLGYAFAAVPLLMTVRAAMTFLHYLLVRKMEPLIDPGRVGSDAMP